MWDFRCPQLAGWAGSLLPEQPNCQGNQTAPTLSGWERLTCLKSMNRQLTLHWDEGGGGWKYDSFLYIYIHEYMNSLFLNYKLCMSLHSFPLRLSDPHIFNHIDILCFAHNHIIT